MDAYWKYQAEKERKLYAMLDAFNQNNGHLNVTDAPLRQHRQAVHQRHQPARVRCPPRLRPRRPPVPGPGRASPALMQSLDEIRHAQTQVHSISNYNKYYNGMHDFHPLHDRVWFLSVPKSFFDDAITAGPFGVHGLDRLLVRVRADQPAVRALRLGRGLQRRHGHDDLRLLGAVRRSASHDAGPRVIKFILEQDPANVPIVQRWIDKWTWRGYRVLTLVAMMMDHMLPKRTMSWKEAWECTSRRTAVRCSRTSRATASKPKGRADRPRARTISARAWVPSTSMRRPLPHMDAGARMRWPGWRPKYPDSFDKHYRPRLEFWRESTGRR